MTNGFKGRGASNPRLRRYLVCRCRPSVFVTTVILTVGLWVSGVLLFFPGEDHETDVLSDAENDDVTFADNGHFFLSLEENRKVLRAPTHLATTIPGHSAKRVREAYRSSSSSSSSKNQQRGRKEERKKTGKKEMEEVFQQRRDLYQRRCNRSMDGDAKFVYFHRPSKLAVCAAQKAGCSYWKRIFHFLNNETNGQRVASPFQIDRFYVHFGIQKKTRPVSYFRYKKMVDKLTKVMFTRDPWSRVWSAYVDKLVLPDSWLDHGRAIVQRRNKTVGQNSSKDSNKDSKDNTNRRRFRAAAFTFTCPHNVTFQEFLDYALNGVKDAHWEPVHQLCNPCSFQPSYVGKVETFSEDSAHILNKAGLGRLIRGHESSSSHSEDEMRMLTKYHYQIFATRGGIRRCLNYTGLAGRLWKAFVLNGYIAANLTFPVTEFSAVLKKARISYEAGQKAIELLLKYHRLLPAPSSQEMAQHRRRVMVQEYRKAPPALLNKLAQTFKTDFDLFGYDARPDDIFTS